MSVMILRGLPGSGKSFQAKKLNRNHGSKIFSADDFFMHGGEYRYVPEDIGMAHTECFRRALYAMTEDTGQQIIIDNTNTRNVEIAPYVALAQAYRLEFYIHTIWIDPIVAFQRQRHNVPLKTILRMHQNLVEDGAVMPAWWVHSVEMAEL